MLTKIKFIDGPLTGQEMTVAEADDHILIGPKGAPFFIYSFAGKENRTHLYAKLPPQHAVRKMIWMYVGRFGKDPRVARAAAMSVPFKRTGPTKRGQGARRRAMKREAASATT